MISLSSSPGLGMQQNFRLEFHAGAVNTARKILTRRFTRECCQIGILAIFPPKWLTVWIHAFRKATVALTYMLIQPFLEILIFLGTYWIYTGAKLECASLEKSRFHIWPLSCEGHVVNTSFHYHQTCVKSHFWALTVSFFCSQTGVRWRFWIWGEWLTARWNLCVW